MPRLRHLVLHENCRAGGRTVMMVEFYSAP